MSASSDLELRLFRILAELEREGWHVYIEATLNGIIRAHLRSPPAVDIQLPLERK